MDNKKDFKREYICNFQIEGVSHTKALELWCDYYLKTEMFDLLLSNAFNNDGEVILTTPSQHSKSNRYALRKYFVMLEEKKYYNIDDESFYRAKKYFSKIKLNVKNLKEQYKIITGKDYETF